MFEASLPVVRMRVDLIVDFIVGDYKTSRYIRRLTANSFFCGKTAKPAHRFLMFASRGLPHLLVISSDKLTLFQYSGMITIASLLFVVILDQWSFWQIQWKSSNRDSERLMVRIYPNLHQQCHGFQWQFNWITPDPVSLAVSLSVSFSSLWVMLH